MSHRKTNTVLILNPAIDGSRYTSRKNAERLVHRGLACYARDGAAISYLASEWLAIATAQEAARQLDDRMIEGRGGVLWWNGCDHSPTACHRPGENVAFPRPDRAQGYMQAMKAGA